MLLVLVNVISFKHFQRVELHPRQAVHPPAGTRGEFGKLRGNALTTIVVHQTHNFGPLMARRNSFTKATEAEVTAKVGDLRRAVPGFGPQFKVVVLDTEAFKYRRQLKELTQDAPELLAAINASPGKQHLLLREQTRSALAFSEVHATGTPPRATRTTSGRRTRPRARRASTGSPGESSPCRSSRPKAAVCVVHELLTTAGEDTKNRYTLAGVRKSLAAQGFDVVDIVLKKNWNNARSFSDLKPAADTREESKLERLEGELDDADADLASSRARRSGSSS